MDPRDITGASMHSDESEFVTLVDRSDKVIGSCEKLEAHRSGKLHRGFSILVFNLREELLLQRRADAKYHFARRWSNSCCGHPRPGELVDHAAHRRIQEELGIVVELEKIADFCYGAKDPVSGYLEHEYLHVYIGQFEGVPEPDPLEVGAWRWMSVQQIKRVLSRSRNVFTPWFQMLARQLFR